MLIFHAKEASGRRVCVAATIVDGDMRFGTAICSPKDSYNRKLGRTIASGRANVRPGVVIPVGGRDEVKLFLTHAQAIAASEVEKFKK